MAVEFFEDLHALLQMGALDFFGHVLVVNPLQTVAGHFVTQLVESLGQLTVLLRAVATPNTVSGRPRFSIRENAPHAHA